VPMTIPAPWNRNRRPSGDFPCFTEVADIWTWVGRRGIVGAGPSIWRVGGNCRANARRRLKAYPYLCRHALDLIRRNLVSSFFGGGGGRVEIPGSSPGMT